MIYVVDTHPLVWHLEGDTKLSASAAAILSSDAAEIVIPSIVLAEVWYLYQRKRIKTSPRDIRSTILAATNCSIYPLDEAVLEVLPNGLDIHDALIVATAPVYQDVLKQPTQLITRDRMITDSKLVDVLW
ncbi:MAG: PIN domain-containing protein [Phycisphaeraceae bacterium]